MKTSVAPLALALALPACLASQAVDPSEAARPGEPSLERPASLPGDEAAVLALVGYPAVDAAMLVHEVGLAPRSAAAIVVWRDGPDALAPSDDDQRFTSVNELVAIAGLDEGDLLALAAYAEAHPAPADVIVEGVAFLGWQSEAAVWRVNHADPAALDALLDARAAAGLVAARAFATLGELGEVPFVGPTALEALLADATVAWGEMHAAPGGRGLGGVFDRVVVDDAEAWVVLDIANRASRAQLEEHLVIAPASFALVASRPYATLDDVAAVDGVGTVTMQRLLAYARSGRWQ